jgi:hypothetical protein
MIVVHLQLPVHDTELRSQLGAIAKRLAGPPPHALREM